MRHLRELVAERPGSRRSRCRTPALLAYARVFSSVACIAPDRAERHQQPLPLEVGHDQVEALVLLAEQVLLGHADVVEARSAPVSDACQPSFSIADRLDALAALDDQEREPVVAALGGRLHRGDEKSARTPLVMNIFEPLTRLAAVDAHGAWSGSRRRRSPRRAR